MTKFLDWIAKNRLSTGIFAAAVAGLLIMTMANGCSLGDLVKVKVPKPVASVTGVPTTVTLNQAVDVREQYIQDTARALSTFDNNIERADRLRAFFADFLNTGFTIGQESLQNSGFPMGGALALALGGLGGLFVEKPGTKQKIQAAKDESYDQGRVEAVHTLNSTKAVVV